MRVFVIVEELNRRSEKEEKGQQTFMCIYPHLSN